MLADQSGFREQRQNPQQSQNDNQVPCFEFSDHYRRPSYSFEPYDTILIQPVIVFF